MPRVKAKASQSTCGPPPKASKATTATEHEPFGRNPASGTIAKKPVGTYEACKRNPTKCPLCQGVCVKAFIRPYNDPWADAKPLKEPERRARTKYTTFKEPVKAIISEEMQSRLTRLRQHLQIYLSDFHRDSQKELEPIMKDMQSVITGVLKLVPAPEAFDNALNSPRSPSKPTGGEESRPGTSKTREVPSRSTTAKKREVGDEAEELEEPKPKKTKRSGKN